MAIDRERKESAAPMEMSRFCRRKADLCLRFAKMTEREEGAAVWQYMAASWRQLMQIRERHLDETSGSGDEPERN